MVKYILIFGFVFALIQLIEIFLPSTIRKIKNYENRELFAKRRTYKSLYIQLIIMGIATPITLCSIPYIDKNCTIGSFFNSLAFIILLNTICTIFKIKKSLNLISDEIKAREQKLNING